MQSPMKILLAVDGSEHSQAATSLLCDLPLPSGSLIYSLSVLSPLHTYQRPVLEAALEQASSTLQTTNLDVTTELLVGHPALEIVEFADQYQPDLIVLGAKGLRATLGILLGGVAQQVVELASQPVLIVRYPYTGIQRILLVTDGSIYSQHALEYTTRFSPYPNISVQVMHVLPPPSAAELLTKSGMFGLHSTAPVPMVEIDEAVSYRDKETEHAGKELLEKAIKILATSGVKAMSVLQKGDAATEILAYVKEHEIDLVVAGSRGLSQVRGWIMGSVSRKIVHYAGCSVLIVKGEQDETG